MKYYVLEMNNGIREKYLKIEDIGVIHPALMDNLRRAILYNYYGWNSDGPYKWMDEGYRASNYEHRKNIDCFKPYLYDDAGRAAAYNYHSKINVKLLCAVIGKRDLT